LGDSTPSLYTEEKVRYISISNNQQNQHWTGYSSSTLLIGIVVVVVGIVATTHFTTHKKMSKGIKRLLTDDPRMSSIVIYNGVCYLQVRVGVGDYESESESVL
jgi:hypothetical protein